MTDGRGGHDPPAGESSDRTTGREYTLAEVAELTDMTPRNVRAYQQRQLLPPAERRGRRVVYTYEHVTRVRLVRALHDHGLTLRVIGDLIERGAAASELARLGREDVAAPVGNARMVPMNPASVAWTEANRPGRMTALEEAGLVRRQGGRAMASAAGLGLTGALAGRGFDLDVSTHLSLLAARAAESVAPEVAAVAGAARPDHGPTETEDLLMLVQLAATAFGDSLRGRLTDP